MIVFTLQILANRKDVRALFSTYCDGTVPVIIWITADRPHAVRTARMSRANKELTPKIFGRV